MVDGGLGSAGLMMGLNDLREHFQHKWFCDFKTSWSKYFFSPKQKLWVWAPKGKLALHLPSLISVLMLSHFKPGWIQDAQGRGFSCHHCFPCLGSTDLSWGGLFSKQPITTPQTKNELMVAFFALQAIYFVSKMSHFISVVTLVMEVRVWIKMSQSSVPCVSLKTEFIWLLTSDGAPPQVLTPSSRVGKWILVNWMQNMA